MTFRAQVPGEIEYRDVVGEMLRAVCRHVTRHRGLDEGVEWRMISAFNEAFNNVAEHATVGMRDSAVDVALGVEEARLVLEISDRGPGFDFDARDTSTPPPPDAMDDGGMGLFIIRRSMSRVRYERGDVNRLTMILDLPVPAAPGGRGPAETGEGTQC